MGVTVARVRAAVWVLQLRRPVMPRPYREPLRPQRDSDSRCRRGGIGGRAGWRPLRHHGGTGYRRDGLRGDADIDAARGRHRDERRRVGLRLHGRFGEADASPVGWRRWRKRCGGSVHRRDGRPALHRCGGLRRGDRRRGWHRRGSRRRRDGSERDGHRLARRGRHRGFRLRGQRRRGQRRRGWRRRGRRRRYGVAGTRHRHREGLQPPFLGQRFEARGDARRRDGRLADRARGHAVEQAGHARTRDR